jgi:hypothetical protein
MIEEDLITDLHALHEVSRLIVSYAIPAGRLAWGLFEVIDREDIRFRLHQPVAHGQSLLSET